MGKALKVFTLVLLLVLLSIAQTTQAQVAEVVKVQSVSQSSGAAIYAPNAKLKITPAFKHTRLQPGESESFEIKVKNIGDKDVTVKPELVQMPYAPNTVDEDWLKIEPEKTVLKAKEECRIKIEVSVPRDAEKGFYSAMIALTNDTVASPYPTPYPMYVNKLMLSVNVWIPPQVVIKQRYIHDVVEAGKNYEYKIIIENMGDRGVTLNPVLKNERIYYDFYSPVQLTEDMVQIESPKQIPPKSKAEVKIRVNVPADAKGVLRGGVQLNIDDPGLDEWMQRIDINLNVWQKPTEPYVKEVVVENVSKLRFEVSATSQAFRMYRSVNADFDVKIKSPSGYINIKPSKKVEVVGVTLSASYLPPWEGESEGIYRVTKTEKTEVYIIENPENGVWRIEVMPKCNEFSLKVEVE